MQTTMRSQRLGMQGRTAQAASKPMIPKAQRRARSVSVRAEKASGRLQICGV